MSEYREKRRTSDEEYSYLFSMYINFDNGYGTSHDGRVLSFIQLMDGIKNAEQKSHFMHGGRGWCGGWYVVGLEDCVTGKMVVH